MVGIVDSSGTVLGARAVCWIGPVVMDIGGKESFTWAGECFREDGEFGWTLDKD